MTTPTGRKARSPGPAASGRRRAVLIAAATGQPWADPQPVRDHVTRLREHGGSYTAIAAAAGVAAMTVHAIAHGQARITTATAAALLAVHPSDLRHARVDAGGTRLRLRALHVMGHNCARIARAADISDPTLQKITRGQAATITPRLRDAVTAIYDVWWDKRAPERTRAERAAAAAARRRARDGNWCAAAALDDDQLDIPGYQPAWGWLPATGTGTVTDLQLPTPHAQAGTA